MHRTAVAIAVAVLTVASTLFAASSPPVFDRPPAGESSEGSVAPQTASGGIGVIVPVVGRLFGGGGLLYVTSLDVSNFAPTSTTTEFQFRGSDVATGDPITVSGGFQVSGGAPLGSFNSIHFDDFIDALTQGGFITPTQENHGVLGSLVIVFGGVSTSGQCTARARFYSQQFGGTIGVALNGHEFNGTETTAVIGVFSDTTTSSSLPHLYSNVFLTNLGQFQSGGFVTSDDTVVVTAYDPTTAALVGQPKTIPLGTGRTVSMNLTALGVPAGAGRVIVVAKATSGQGLLLGVGSENDADTKDPSGFEMLAASPSIAPPGGGTGGDLASSLPGTWNGTWNNTTFSTVGSAKLVISTNTSAKTWTATLTLGGGVFGGSAPPAQSFSGSYSTSSGATFSGHDSLFGDITFAITPAGAISGSATNIPSGNVSAMTFTGTATATTITIHYTLQLKPSGSASGTVTLTKAP